MKLIDLLSDWNYNIEDFYDLLNNIKTGYKDLECAKSNPEEFDEEEIEFLKTDIDDWEKELAEIKAEFVKTNGEANWEEDIEALLDVLKDVESEREG